MTAATSLAAYAFLKEHGLLSPAREEAWKYLVEHGPCTKGEVNQALGRAVGNPSYHRRVDELVQMGLAQYAGLKKCPISGYEAETFVALIPGEDDLKLIKAPSRIGLRPSKKTIKRAIVSMETAFAAAWRINVAPGDDVAAVMAWLKRLGGP